MNPNAPILIVGAGSIGERHIGVLQRLGYVNLHVFRQRNLPLRNVAADSIQIFTDWALIEQIKPVAAIICSPTAQHLPQALDCAKKGVHLLIEKPLSHTLAGLDEFKKVVLQNDLCVQVAYMLRYHPLLQRAQQLIESQALGNLLSLQSYWGEYLPDWHPWEDYRSSYAARKELGGGVALTLSHDLDLLAWWAGASVESWHTMKNYRSNLEVNTESGADVNLAYANGVRAHAHLNFFEQVPCRNYRLVFDVGSVEIDYFANRMTISTKKGQEIVEATNFERNQLFEDQTRAFLANCEAPNRAQRSEKAIAESARIIEICN